MDFQELIKKASKLPVFTVGFLSAGKNPAQIRLQINRWVKDGKVIRINKGLYTLADPYRKVNCEPFFIANSLKKASYVSLHSALSWYGMIPEFVPSITCVSTGRPQTIQTPVGRFEFRHLSKKYFWGYHQIELSSKQNPFIAYPEKALLDLVYLTPGADDANYIDQLRLQNLERLDHPRLKEFVNRFNSPKIERALINIRKNIEQGEGTEL